MAITNNFLNEIAKALNNESYNTPSYLAVGTTDVANVLITDTVLAGEMATRTAFTGSRSNNIITLSAIRSGAIITNPTGVPIRSSGIYNGDTTATSDPLLAGITHAGIIQTTNFDIDFTYQFTITR